MDPAKYLKKTHSGRVILWMTTHGTDPKKST